jgi:hypothetical protein
MALFDTNAITSAANSDGEFKLAARLWSADIRLEEIGRASCRERV